jgi:hypothetical protein
MATFVCFFHIFKLFCTWYNFNQFRFRKEVLYFLIPMSFLGASTPIPPALSWTRWGPRRCPDPSYILSIRNTFIWDRIYFYTSQARIQDFTSGSTLLGEGSGHRLGPHRVQHPEVDLPYEYLGNSLWAAQTSNTLIKNVPTWQVRNAMTDFKIHLSSVWLISYLNTFVLDSIHETGAG